MGVLIFSICVCFYLSNCSCHQDLDMRFGFNLCSEEMAFLGKRKRYVASALKNVFHLPHDLQDQEVRVCWGGRTWISSVFMYSCRWVVSKTGHTYLLYRYQLSMCLKYICFYCQGLLLKTPFAVTILHYYQFGIFHSWGVFIPARLSSHCLGSEILNAFHSKDFFSPYSSFTTLWEFRTKIFECFLYLLFLAVLKFLKIV